MSTSVTRAFLPHVLRIYIPLYGHVLKSRDDDRNAHNYYAPVTRGVVTEGLVYGPDVGVAQPNARFYLAFQDGSVGLVNRPPHERT
jgi:hypothetical protein